MSLLESEIFDDQNELSKKIYKDLESILGCALEIDCLIEYFQGSQPQLVNMGLNKLYNLFNHSNLMHLEIKQQLESQIGNKQAVLGVKNESIQITLEVQKQIIDKQIQQTLNFHIDKNLAQFNIPFQLELIKLEQFNQYSKESLKDLFHSDEQTYHQFIQRKSSLKESSFLRRSLSLKVTTSIKSVILEKIEYRKQTMINKLEHRFPKLASFEPIIPYILGLFINIESEGLFGDFQSAKDQLKSVHHTVFTLCFNNFQQILSTEYVKLLVKLDFQQFVLGNFKTSFQIEFDKIITQSKWVESDKSMIQQLLFSSKLNGSFQIENQKLDQLGQLIQTFNQKIILIFQQIIPHEQGNFDNNSQIVDQLLQELEQEKNYIIKSQTINQEIILAFKKILQQIIKLLNKFQVSLHSKFGIKALYQLKLILQDSNKKLIKQKPTNEYYYKCVSELENKILRLFKKNIIFASSELISLIIQSVDKHKELENVLCDLKYGNATQQAICEISQIQDFISNEQIKQFLQNVVDYLQDKIKKKDINFNLGDLQLTLEEEMILKCINNQHLIEYVKENRKFFKIISNYILANDPFTSLTLRQYQSLQSAIEISILAIKFCKESSLNEFLRLFFDFQINRDSQQLKLQSQLNQSELQEWKNILQLFE
ncbi:unnamed protein product [Paramecium sonneborni]|uniref:Uncharacterized protein n=1 Tax=Paramecium sonneborni TaxID=65129 RepID=A0A8S1QWH6_9CILI|nr:unnamed protein product [Paramecium sonneborni]